MKYDPHMEAPVPTEKVFFSNQQKKMKYGLLMGAPVPPIKVIFSKQ